ncbi:hypothetical protein B1813_22395 [Saccharomonospora piscinae]|uniref:Transposase n=1 Tax=Saccharomonospora piscinae TaxID=687388 RepID=A0A1V8ZXI1_SACPI|nr:hypothetical protein B1813_22395 [Saccharomonospora piscinae]
MLYTGIGLESLAQELGFGSGMTCWRRLRDWQQAGVFDRLHEVLLAELNAATAIDWSRACVDASHVRAKGAQTRASPVDLDRHLPPPPTRSRSSAPRSTRAARWGVRARSSSAARGAWASLPQVTDVGRAGLEPAAKGL